MLLALAGSPKTEADGGLPSGFTMSSGPIPGDFNPTVSVYTSPKGAEILKTDPVKTAAGVKKVEVDVIEKVGINAALGCEHAATVLAPKAKPEPAKPKPEPAKPKVEPAKPKVEPTPDARSLVEAVVGVKTGTVEAEGTVDEVVAALEKGEDVIDAATTKAIKALSLKCAKYGKMPEAKASIRAVVNVGGPVKLSEIPAKNGDAVIEILTDIVKGAEDNG